MTLSPSPSPRGGGLRARLAAVSWRQLLPALALGTAGGALFHVFNLPLAWMIGAMVATTAACLAGARIAVPGELRSGMIMVLGIMLGSGFSPEMLDHMGRWSISLAMLVPFIIASLLAGMLYLKLTTRYHPATAYFTAAPGGFNEMVLSGGANGGDERAIALAHSARVMLVVFTIPIWFEFLHGADRGNGGTALGPGLTDLSVQDWLTLAACAIGYPIARALRIPAAALVGPMVLSAAVHLAGLTANAPPGLIVAIAQVVVGSAIGSRFVGSRLSAIFRTLLVATGLTAVLVVVAVAFAWGVHLLTGIGLVDLILAFAPGGLAEMSLVALALGVDAAFVATHHIVRIALIVLFAPAGYLLWRRLFETGGPPSPPS